MRDETSSRVAPWVTNDLTEAIFAAQSWQFCKRRWYADALTEWGQNMYQHFWQYLWAEFCLDQVSKRFQESEPKCVVSQNNTSFCMIHTYWPLLWGTSIEGYACTYTSVGAGKGKLIYQHCYREGKWTFCTFIDAGKGKSYAEKV